MGWGLGLEVQGAALAGRGCQVDFVGVAHGWDGMDCRDRLPAGRGDSPPLIKLSPSVGHAGVDGVGHLVHLCGQC
jgi:hypothetical protein